MFVWFPGMQLARNRKCYSPIAIGPFLGIAAFVVTLLVRSNNAGITNSPGLKKALETAVEAKVKGNTQSGYGNETVKIPGGEDYEGGKYRWCGTCKIGRDRIHHK